MKLHVKRALSALGVVLLLSSCAGPQPLELPASSPTMIEVFERHAANVISAKQQRVTHGLSVAEDAASSSRRYPVLHVYVFPVAMTHTVEPMPGYWRTIPLRTAMPNTDKAPSQAD